MALAASLVLIAVGAVLTWATGGEAAGVHLESVGVAVMVVGGATLLAALVLGSERDRRHGKEPAAGDRASPDDPGPPVDRG